MAEPIVIPPHAPPPADRELFSLHPEEEMTERPSHRRQVGDLDYAIHRARPDLFVAVNMGVYWVPGELEYPSAGPDLLVSRHRPQREDSAVYLTYEDGPLALVAEVASPRTRQMDLLKRDAIYAAELQVPEYLWIDLPRRVLELWRLEGATYALAPADAEGRIWSRELELGFAWQADRRFVRVVLPDGTVLPTAHEEGERAEREAERAAREARRAEHEAEQRAAAEQRARAAEQIAATERRRAEALAAELERLRQALDEVRGPADGEGRK
jgi:hypothetical protein